MFIHLHCATRNDHELPGMVKIWPTTNLTNNMNWMNKQWIDEMNNRFAVAVVSQLPGLINLGCCWVFTNDVVVFWMVQCYLDIGWTQLG